MNCYNKWNNRDTENAGKCQAYGQGRFMKCENCGCSLLENDKFCPKCGFQIQSGIVQPNFPKKLKNTWEDSSTFRGIILFVGLVILCSAGYVLLEGVTKVFTSINARKYETFFSKLNAACENAPDKEITPGKVVYPVFGTVIGLRQESINDNGQIWDQLHSSYSGLDDWIVEKLSQGGGDSFNARTALCFYRRDIQIHTCSYINYSIDLYQQRFDAYLVDVNSQELLGKNTFSGGSPGDCPKSGSRGNGSGEIRTGESVSTKIILDWIKSLPAE
jgi:hypothetical protein